MKIPIIRPKSETTTAPTPWLVIFSAASPIVSDGSTDRTSFVITSPSVGIAASIGEKRGYNPPSRAISSVG